MSQLTILAEIESTNDYAKSLIKANKAHHGTGIFTTKQTQGKGRRENKWISEPGKNIALSVITQMQNHDISSQPTLSMISALAVSRLIENNTDLTTSVKWPNDLFVHDKKITGILIENILAGNEWKWAITGFGVNINQLNFEKYPGATSLAFETDTTFPLEKLAAELQNIFLNFLDKWNKMDWLKQYNDKLYKKDETVKVITKNNEFLTTIRGVDIHGNLITEDSETRKWALNELKIVVG